MNNKATFILIIIALIFSIIPNEHFIFGEENNQANATNSCPDEYGGLHNLDIIGHDAVPSFYVGGDYNGKQGARELEGVVLVKGDANIVGEEAYLNVGVTGAGSRVPPPEGADTLMVGGNLTTDRTISINSQLGGNGLIGGEVNDTSLVDTNEGELRQNVNNPFEGYPEWPNNFKAWSNEYAAKTANGEVDIDTFNLRLIGDGSSEVQVFEIPVGALTDDTSRAIHYDNIPEQAEIIINVLDKNPTLNSISTFNDGEFITFLEAFGGTEIFVDRTTHTVWNFVNAEEVNLAGASQLFGSVFVPNDDSVTNIETSLNGRIYLAGDVNHGDIFSGLGIHNYPLLPAFPCDTTPDVDNEATPEAPKITQGYCDEDGNPVDPIVELADTEGITYTIDGEVEAGNTITIIATPGEGFQLTEADGWMMHDDGTATLEVILDEVDCEEPIIEVAPESPEVTQAYCDEDGNPVDPIVELADTEGITYTIDGEVEAGNTITIVAKPGEGFQLTEADGWMLQDDGTATLEVALDYVNCDEPVIEVTPENPEITQGYCDADGNPVNPVVELAETEGITYTIEGEVEAGNTITIVAKPGEGFQLTEAEGWTLHNDDGTATLEVILDEVDCEEPIIEVAPESPEVTQAYCDEDGNPVDPIVELADTEGITYTIDGDVEAGNTITIVAKPGEGFQLTEADGWTMYDDGTATLEVALDYVNCDEPVIEVTPENPEITQGYCDADGNPVDPIVELADTEGITYTIEGDVEAGNTITIVAKPGEGFQLTEADGWTMHDDGTATLEVPLDYVNCDEPVMEVTPEAPKVTQAYCDEDGNPVDPIVELADTEGITYTIDGDVEASNTITIVAKPGEGFQLTEAEGWTLNDDGMATLEVILDEVDCEDPVMEVTPEAPKVTQAYCDEEGDPVNPIVELADTEGITYTIEGDVEAGNTITIVAKPGEGFQLTEAEGWTLHDDGTATIEISLDEVNCESATDPDDDNQDNDMDINGEDNGDEDTNIEEDGKSKLPKTATNTMNLLFGGLVALLAGIILLFIRKEGKVK